jgi:hypothetical protein
VSSVKRSVAAGRDAGFAIERRFCDADRESLIAPRGFAWGWVVVDTACEVHARTSRDAVGSMRASGWHNGGAESEPGAYGIKFAAADRDRFARRVVR